jgi:hypothetical protein
MPEQVEIVAKEGRTGYVIKTASFSSSNIDGRRYYKVYPAPTFWLYGSKIK